MPSKIASAGSSGSRTSTQNHTGTSATLRSESPLLKHVSGLSGSEREKTWGSETRLTSGGNTCTCHVEDAEFFWAHRTSLNSSRRFAAAQSANPRRKANFKTFLAGASESRVVRENNVAAVLADQPPIGGDGHRRKLVIDNAVWTMSFFLRHSRIRSFGEGMSKRI